MNMNQKAKGNNNTQVAIENFNSNVNNISSIIANVLPNVSSIVSSDETLENDTTAYQIDDKITHNNLRTFNEIIDEYGEYGQKIDDLYNEFDNSQPGFRKNVFKYFRTKYLLKKERLCSEAPDEETIEVIRKNSDKVIRDIFEEFKSEILKSNNLTINLEEVETCALAVTCHAFINCKILEKPASDN